ncbi:MAG: hypothetical protein IJ480_02160 [Clostridia bacterium]|nr:hypothetical protein [Clostridia bacterium]
MYLITHMLKNLLRCRRRYLITAAAILLPMTIFFYAGFCFVQFRAYNLDCAGTYLRRVEMRFRDDLQYRGSRGSDDTMTKFINPAENFNADGSMDGYDIPVYADKAWFAPLETLPSVEALELAYGTFVYGDLVTFPGAEQKTGKIVLYGGALSTWTYYENERIQYNTMPVELRLTEGREAVPGKNECVLYRDFAAWNGLGTGDRIPLYSETGELLTELTVVGLAACFTQTKDGWMETELSDLALVIGSMPYDRIHGMMFACVYTDFDTAYGIRGMENAPDFAENHTFNHYIPMIRLTSPEAYADFQNEVQALGYDAVFGFCPLAYAMEKYAVESDEAGAQVILTVMGGLGIVIICGALLLQFRERRMETGVMYALGISRKRILFCWAGETVVFLFMAAVPALGLSASVDGILGLFGRTFFIDTFRFTISGAGFGYVILYTWILWFLAVLGYGICLAVMKPFTGQEAV